MELIRFEKELKDFLKNVLKETKTQDSMNTLGNSTSSSGRSSRRFILLIWLIMEISDCTMLLLSFQVKSLSLLLILYS